MSKIACKKIFVGLSGGVDSSVSALLLKDAGHDVVGVFIKVWQADFLPCSWREERRIAMRAAAHLGIPFLTLDLEKEYKKDVVDYMIAEYAVGRVPNPDVMCNKHVKFGAFLDFALQRGADLVATGHYARIVESSESVVRSKYKMLRGVDPEKDQSYFLWTLTQQQLARTLFPVGHLKKSEVRALAKKYELPNADKKDSQGLCFMGKVDMAEFLQHYLKTSPGPVLDENGKVIGEHDGALLYAIGQRSGIRYADAGPLSVPRYVVAKNISRNTLAVSPRLPLPARVDTVFLESINDLSPGGLAIEGEGCVAEYRYHGEKEPVEIVSQDGTLLVRFTSAAQRSMSVGQSVVFYRGEECLGGGIISSIL